MGTVAADVVEGHEDADDDAEVLKTKSKWLQRLLNHKVCDVGRRGIGYKIKTKIY